MNKHVIAIAFLSLVIVTTLASCTQENEIKFDQRNSTDEDTITELREAWVHYDNNQGYLKMHADFLSTRCIEIISRECFNQYLDGKIISDELKAVSFYEHDTSNERFISVITAKDETLYFLIDNYQTDNCILSQVWKNNVYEDESTSLLFAACYD